MTLRHDSVACVLGFSIVILNAAMVLPARSVEPVPLDQLPKLKYQRWSGPINVPDPVAISVADNGDVYVTQTQRRKIQDLDIRAHKRWIPDDVGLTSVDEKRAFYHRMLAIGGDQVTASKDVEDVNGDGTHDWRDLTVISEKIHRLVDTDGDGVADEINLFAEDFKTEVTGIAAGVMHWKDSLRHMLLQIEKRPELAKIESPKFRQFAMAVEGGDAKRGETIFRTDLRAQCSRCHRIGKSGSNIGPELTKIAKQRDGQHLLRAIVYPSADIEKKYNAQSLLLADGSVVRGVIKSEDDRTTVLIDSDGKEIEIPSDEIEDVSKSKVSLMPDMTAVLSPSEVRDLVAYLKTLR